METGSTAGPVAGQGRGVTNRWALWGTAAGVLGLVAHLVFDPQGSLEPEQRQTGAEVLELVSAGGYHVGALAGFLAIGCLLVFAAGWRRWAEGQALDNLAARLVPTALTASAGAMIIGYGFKGTLAIYLNGGLDAGQYPPEGLYTLFMINDLAPYMAWWGVAVAAAAVAWLALRERLVSRWVGVISVVAALVPLGFVAVTGLTGFAGVVTPLWLIAASLGLAGRRG